MQCAAHDERGNDDDDDEGEEQEARSLAHVLILLPARPKRRWNNTNRSG